jgi:hypothetical protein
MKECIKVKINRIINLCCRRPTKSLAGMEQKEGREERRTSRKIMELSEKASRTLLWSSFLSRSMFAGLDQINMLCVRPNIINHKINI